MIDLKILGCVIDTFLIIFLNIDTFVKVNIEIFSFASIFAAIFKFLFDKLELLPDLLFYCEDAIVDVNYMWVLLMKIQSHVKWILPLVKLNDIRLGVIRYLN